MFLRVFRYFVCIIPDGYFAGTRINGFWACLFCGTMKYLRRIAFVDLRPSVKEGFSALRRKNLHSAIFPKLCSVQCRFSTSAGSVESASLSRDISVMAELSVTLWDGLGLAVCPRFGFRRRKSCHQEYLKRKSTNQRESSVPPSVGEGRRRDATEPKARQKGVRRAKERSDWAESTTKGRANAHEHTHKSIRERRTRGTKWLKPWTQREALASTWEQAEGWRLRHGVRGKRNAIRHDSRITSFISGWFCYKSTF